MNETKADVPWYPPVVPAIVKSSSSAASARSYRRVAGDAWWLRRWTSEPRAAGFSPVPNLMLANVLA